MVLTAQQEDHSFEAFLWQLEAVSLQERVRQTDMPAGSITSERDTTGRIRDLWNEPEAYPESHWTKDFSSQCPFMRTVTPLAGNLSAVIVLPRWRKNSAKKILKCIPKAQLGKNLEKIQTRGYGCLWSNIEGLDISMWLCLLWNLYLWARLLSGSRGLSNGKRRLGFLHASSKAKKVVMDEMTLTGMSILPLPAKCIRIVRWVVDQSTILQDEIC